MPTYEYRCLECDHEFEAIQKMSDKPFKKCPECQGNVKRLIGSGAGIIFKGTGFYETDYRSDGYKKAAEKDNKAASTGDDSKTGSKTKSDTGTDSSGSGSKDKSTKRSDSAKSD